MSTDLQLGQDWQLGVHTSVRTGALPLSREYVYKSPV